MLRTLAAFALQAGETLTHHTVSKVILPRGSQIRAVVMQGSQHGAPPMVSISSIKRFHIIKLFLTVTK